MNIIRGNLLPYFFGILSCNIDKMLTFIFNAFTKITNYSDETLAIKSLIRELIDYNVIRVKGSIVYEGEHIWAKSIEELELILVDPKNSEVYDSFKDKVKNKMKLSVI